MLFKILVLSNGDLAKFQPHQKEFIDFAAALGVRNVLDLAMQHYSALSVGQTIIIQYGRDKYELDVVELQPRKSISLYGTVDLKVEFAPWDGPRILDLPPAHLRKAFNLITPQAPIQIID